VRALGHDKTIATGWAGAGSFRELLRQGLPEQIRVTEAAPYLAYDAKRHRTGIAAALDHDEIPMELTSAALAPLLSAPPVSEGGSLLHVPSPVTAALTQTDAAARRDGTSKTAAAQGAGASAIEQSIARIHEACQAPPMAPHEYRLLFELMAKEINENELIGAQTIANITQRAQERGLDVRRDDVRFVLEVVSESDPWFEQGASANLFAGRFRNFVVARCRGQGLHLSADELDLVDAWFAGGSLPQGTAAPQPPAASQPTAAKPRATPQAIAAAPQTPASVQPGGAGSTPTSSGTRWWARDDARAKEGGSEIRNATGSQPQASAGQDQSDDFPRFVRNRQRG
jgi:hypothetical protein